MAARYSRVQFSTTDRKLSTSARRPCDAARCRGPPGGRRRRAMTDTTADAALGEVTETPVNLDNGGLPAGLPMPRDPDLLPDGAPRTMDAHCPHLGAHLAVGGRVEDGCIRCPFHGWRFDGGSGECVEIPYGDTKHIPPKAHARAYPTLERNHMVWAWYHAQGGEPFYDVPEVPEFHDDDWSPILVRDFEVRVSAQDMAENNVDFSHFRYVHGSDSIPDDDMVTDGTYKKTVSGGGTFIREGFGLGLGVLRITGMVTFLSSTTPLDAGNVHVRWVFTAPKANGENAVTQAADSFCAGVSQDIPIWENKVSRAPPVVTKTEKLILEHRRWARQFYSDPID